MNKKIFAALASATMALSATGSLAVFAEDFDVVTEADGNNGVVSGVVIPNSGIVINEENFPDKAFRQDILNGKVVTGTTYQYGDKISKKEAESVKTLTIGDGVANTAGIEYFTNLETVATANASANALETVDLSKNVKLEIIDFLNVPELTTLSVPATKVLQNVKIVGGQADTTASNGLTGPFGTGGAYLPTGSYDAETLAPKAYAPIFNLDLSANKGLESVTVVATNIANIDLSNNIYLENVNVAGNKINTLDLTNNDALTTLVCASNQLYSLDLPETDQLTTLAASNNILQSIDLSSARGLRKLFLQHNELRSLDLSAQTNLHNLNVAYNHIGALDVSATNVKSGIEEVSPQIVYVDSAYDAVNLTDSFADLDKDEVRQVYKDTWDKKAGQLTISNDGPTNGKTDWTQYFYDVNGQGKMQVYVMKEAVLNRLYNPNSGEHFYTRDLEEKDALVKLGWQDEGIGWTAPTKSNTPVYRLYNPNAGDHHYTKRSTERDVLVSVGWKYEGVGWYSYDSNIVIPQVNKTIHTVDVVREYNPNAKAAGAHNYTVNRAENDFLVSIGWLDEGVAWQAMK